MRIVPTTVFTRESRAELHLLEQTLARRTSKKIYCRALVCKNDIRPVWFPRDFLARNSIGKWIQRWFNNEKCYYNSHHRIKANVASRYLQIYYIPTVNSYCSLHYFEHFSFFIRDDCLYHSLVILFSNIPTHVKIPLHRWKNLAQAAGWADRTLQWIIVTNS